VLLAILSPTPSSLHEHGVECQFSLFVYAGSMGVLRMDHVGINVDDLDAATAFFVGIGLEASEPWITEGVWADRIVGLDGVRSESVMLSTLAGDHKIELSHFLSPLDDAPPAPAPANRHGIRHLAFPVDDLDGTLASVRAAGFELIGEVQQYEDQWRLCYVRGPEGIIVELAEELGG
jgi:catechol 2,3-dioxygenase-like lactoylglutathione lyase family enzyme